MSKQAWEEMREMFLECINVMKGVSVTSFYFIQEKELVSEFAGEQIQKKIQFDQFWVCLLSN